MFTARSVYRRCFQAFHAAIQSVFAPGFITLKQEPLYNPENFLRRAVFVKYLQTIAKVGEQKKITTRFSAAIHASIHTIAIVRTPSAAQRTRSAAVICNQQHQLQASALQSAAFNCITRQQQQRTQRNAQLIASRRASRSLFAHLISRLFSFYHHRLPLPSPHLLYLPSRYLISPSRPLPSHTNRSPLIPQ